MYSIYKYQDGAKKIHRAHVKNYFKSIKNENKDNEFFWSSFSKEMLKTMVYGCDFDERRFFASIENIAMQCNFCEKCGNYDPETMLIRSHKVFPLNDKKFKNNKFIFCNC